MPNETMQHAIDEFVLQRITDMGASEPEALQKAFSELDTRWTALQEIIPEEKMPVAHDCENAYICALGETNNAYYRAGFTDAVVFLFGWRDSTWN